MLNYLYTAFLGLVQGIAEFLPISSSGHLSLFQNFFGLKSAEESNLFLDVVLHLGTLISVFIYYWHDIVSMVQEFFRGCAALVHPDPAEKEPPAARRMVLLVTGCLLFISDRLSKGHKTERSVSLVDILLVGCAQAVATVPGLSRSGSTISAAMLLGCRRDFAVRYSFLMSIPAIIGANILSLADAVKAGIDWSMMPAYLVGVIVAAVSGYFAIRLVNSFANKGKFGKFAYYCWGAGILALILSAVL